MRFHKPLQSPCRINMAHPHAQGLVFCSLLNDYGCKSTLNHIDYNSFGVNGGEFLENGFVSDGANHGIILTNTNARYIGSSVGTLIMGFKSFSVMTDNTQRYLFGRFGGVWSEGDLGITKTSENKLFCTFRDSSTHRYIRIENNRLPTWTTFTQIAYQWRVSQHIYDDKNLAININGSYLIPDLSRKANVLLSSNMADNYSIGNDYSDMSQYANGVIYYIYIYNEVLSEVLLKDIYNYSYAMVK